MIAPDPRAADVEQASRELSRAYAQLDADPAPFQAIRQTLERGRAALGVAPAVGNLSDVGVADVNGEVKTLEGLLRKRLERTALWRFRLGIVLVVAVGTAALIALRQAGAETRHAWRAVYFNNTAFQGAGFERHYPRLQLDWGRGHVHPELTAKSMTARFDTCLELARAADVLLWLEAKDGARLRVDGKELINTWRAKSLTRATHRLTLAAGSHPLDVSFYNLAGAGRIIVQASIDGGPLSPLDAQFARLPAAGNLTRCATRE